MYVCMYVCMHACMHACMYVCMHVCMYVCMYVYIYIYCVWAGRYSIHVSIFERAVMLKTKTCACIPRTYMHCFLRRKDMATHENHTGSCGRSQTCCSTQDMGSTLHPLLPRILMDLSWARKSELKSGSPGLVPELCRAKSETSHPRNANLHVVQQLH